MYTKLTMCALWICNHYDCKIGNIILFVFECTACNVFCLSEENKKALFELMKSKSGI